MSLGSLCNAALVVFLVLLLIYVVLFFWKGSGSCSKRRFGSAIESPLPCCSSFPTFDDAKRKYCGDNGGKPTACAASQPGEYWQCQTDRCASDLTLCSWKCDAPPQPTCTTSCQKDHSSCRSHIAWEVAQGKSCEDALEVVKADCAAVDGSCGACGPADCPTPPSPPSPPSPPQPTCALSCLADRGSCRSHIAWEITQGKSCQDALAVVKADCASVDGSCGSCGPADCPTSPPPPPPPVAAGQEGFRFVPLNYATNQRYFKAGVYGCRIAWIDANDVPAKTFTVNGGPSMSWDKQGVINVWKGGKGGQGKQTPAWVKYSYTNLSLPFGPATIVVGPHVYQVLVPRWGDDADSDVLFFGDININEDSYGLRDAARVMQTVIGRNGGTPAACFPGDIFYRDTWQGFVDAWKTLSSTGGKKITEFMVFGVQGNHDYDINGSESLSGIWVPVFFATDGLSSFDDGLQDYRQDSPVPLKNSISVYVLGRTCFILADNKYSGAEVAGAYDWASLNAALGPAVDTVLVSTHWNAINLGAKSDTSEIMMALEGFFPSKRVRGNTNHVHCNGPQNDGIIATGGNGFRSDCASGSASCINNRGCCPTLFSKGTFLETGYGPGQVCGGIGGQGAANLTAAHEPGIQEKLRATFDSSLHVNASSLTPQEMIRYYPPAMLSDDYMVSGRSVMSPLTMTELTSLAKQLPEAQRGNFADDYLRAYDVRDGYPRCSALPPTMPGREGFDCWATPGTSPLQTLKDLGEAIPNGVASSQ